MSENDQLPAGQPQSGTPSDGPTGSPAPVHATAGNSLPAAGPSTPPPPAQPVRSTPPVQPAMSPPGSPYQRAAVHSAPPSGPVGSPAGPIGLLTGHAGEQRPTMTYPAGHYGAYGTVAPPPRPPHPSEQLGPYGGVPTTIAVTPRKRRGGLIGGIAAGALALALVAGGAGAAVGIAIDDQPAANGSSIAVSTATAPTSTGKAGTVEAAAATIAPSVVTINVRTSSAAGTGSGVVLKSDGYILTNNHVVAEAADGGTITVTFTDGGTAAATIVGRDPSTDLAVIKVDRGGLTAATFAKSGQLKVGQSVIAVGAPLGLSNTVTEGIVSAVNRPVRTGDSTSQDAVLDAVQTDAAVNPGNSGGPLVDLNGHVVGINSAIATVSSSAQSQSGNIGVGFAIPSDQAVSVAAQLIDTGSVKHSSLGVSAQDTRDATGATIVAVTPGSAAAQAGLRAGDVVTAVGARKVTDVDSLVVAVRANQVGSTAAVTYRRGGQAAKADVTFADQAS